MLYFVVGDELSSYVYHFSLHLSRYLHFGDSSEMVLRFFWFLEKFW